MQDPPSVAAFAACEAIKQKRQVAARGRYQLSKAPAGSSQRPARPGPARLGFARLRARSLPPPPIGLGLRISEALQDGRLEDSLAAAEEVLQNDEALPNDLMLRLIAVAADSASLASFARAVNVVASGGVKFNENAFAALIGALLSREAPHAQVRCALNFGLRPDADVLPLVPVGTDRESDKQGCFVGTDLRDDAGELDAADLDSSEAAPRILRFGGCALMPKLNGLYSRKPSQPTLLGHSSPIYERRVGNGEKFWCYYYDASLVEEGTGGSWRSGWYIGSEVGGGGRTYARCHDDGLDEATREAPTAAGAWRVASGGRWRQDAAGFAPPASPATSTMLDYEEAQETLSGVDLERLKGSLVGRDVETAAYFAHFFVLVTLEHLAEIAGFHSRWNFRSAAELVSFGLCFNHIVCEDGWGSTEESRRTPLPGWPNRGSQVVKFKLPRGTTEERCRFSPPESVIISADDPRKTKLCEGSVMDVDFVTRSLVVGIDRSKLPERAAYRIDSYANRTTYERQVAALLQFIHMKRTRICDMLVSAGVGQVDLAVLGQDGFAADKDVVGVKAGQALAKKDNRLSELHAAVGNVATIKVCVDRSKGQGLGVGIERGDGQLVVKWVRAGLVEEWNKGHPDMEVRRGDLILRVNDAEGDTKCMVSECNKKEPLVITVRPVGRTISLAQQASQNEVGSRAESAPQPDTDRDLAKAGGEPVSAPAGPDEMATEESPAKAPVKSSETPQRATAAVPGTPPGMAQQLEQEGSETVPVATGTCQKGSPGTPPELASGPAAKSGTRTPPGTPPELAGGLAAETAVAAHAPGTPPWLPQETADDGLGLRRQGKATDEVAPPLREFFVDVDRSQGQDLGMGIERREDYLLVKYIKPGLIEEWNASNPDDLVMTGDHIISINGEQGDADVLVEEFTKQQPLALLVQRPRPGAEIHAPSHPLARDAAAPAPAAEHSVLTKAARAASGGVSGDADVMARPRDEDQQCSRLQLAASRQGS